MPIVATTEGGREFARRRDIGITVQDVTDLVRIFFVDAGEGESGKSFRRAASKPSTGGGVEFSAATAANGTSSRTDKGIFTCRLFCLGGCAPSRPIYFWDDPEIVPPEKLRESRKTHFPGSTYSLRYTPDYAIPLLFYRLRSVS